MPILRLLVGLQFSIPCTNLGYGRSPLIAVQYFQPESSIKVTCLEEEDTKQKKGMPKNSSRQLALTETQTQACASWRTHFFIALSMPNGFPSTKWFPTWAAAKIPEKLNKHPNPQEIHISTISEQMISPCGIYYTVPASTVIHIDVSLKSFSVFCACGFV